MPSTPDIAKLPLGSHPKALEFALWEEDFLWIKLGKLKPQAEPLRERLGKR